jgi:hypothetical protein
MSADPFCSALSPAGGTLWGGLLADSALRRIAEHEGQPLARPTDDEVLAMLAVQTM